MIFFDMENSICTQHLLKKRLAPRTGYAFVVILHCIICISVLILFYQFGLRSFCKDYFMWLFQCEIV